MTPEQVYYYILDAPRLPSLYTPAMRSKLFPLLWGMSARELPLPFVVTTDYTESRIEWPWNRAGVPISWVSATVRIGRLGIRLRHGSERLATTSTQEATWWLQRVLE